MQTAEIRRRWLRFFESQGHTVVPSAPLLYDDPTLLFVNAGMVPFKPYFLGQETPPYPRATSVQKCVRTLDIDEVGKTTRHGTFFQMNGNFSFGDYFKDGAIELAWELVTRSQADGGYGLDPDRLWVTVYHDDDEAVELWRRIAGLPDERIERRGMKDNYWSMGVPGPGGPCSEIYYDRGPEYGPEGGPEVDEDRYLEIWNLVFMQYERGRGRAARRTSTILGELPAKNIDTGMGLERIASLLQGVDNLYEIDEVVPVIAPGRGALRPARTARDHDDDVRLRVVADHVRTGLMLIGDGVTPSQRGPRLRAAPACCAGRSARCGCSASTSPSLPDLLPVSATAMSRPTPSWRPTSSGSRDRVRRGGGVPAHPRRRARRSSTPRSRQAKSAGSAVLAGDQAFQLHDTYGFPIDLTLEMAAEQGLTVDEDGFRRLMTEQRAARQGRRAGEEDRPRRRRRLPRGRRPARAPGRVHRLRRGRVARRRVAGLLVDGEVVPTAAPRATQVELVLDRTPFYAEGGGQLADAGRIEVDGRASVVVDDVQSPLTGLIVHRARVLSGEVARRRRCAQALVDVERRKAISRSHTATHLVHKAHARGARRDRDPGRLGERAGPVPVRLPRRGRACRRACCATSRRGQRAARRRPRGARRVHDARRRRGRSARWRCSARSTATRSGWSRSATGRASCAAARTRARSGQLGLVKLLGEASIGSGVRRVEALVGVDAYAFAAREHVLVGQLTDAAQGAPGGAARPGRRHGRPAARRPEGDRPRSARRRC